jgi:arsenite-transporting ATPase
MARLLLFGGKGGVGKTTCSAATAVRLADAGLRVLLVSSDPAHSTSDSLGLPLSSEPTRVDQVPGLWGLEMDPERRMADIMPRLGDALQGLGQSGPLAGLGAFGGSDIGSVAGEVGREVKASDMLLPGLDEALAFDELLRHIEDLRWDVVVFDTAPTGHTLRFLALPELIDAWSDRLLRLMRASGGIRSMLFGRKESDAMRDELERFRKRVLHVRRILSDPATARFTLVTIPERMGVNETVRANTALREHGLPVTGCVVNRVTPDLDHPFLQRRRDEEQSRMLELEDELDGLTPVQLPLMDTEVHGLPGLRNLAEHLYGPLSTLPESIGPHLLDGPLAQEVHRSIVRRSTEEGEVIELHLPGLDREDLSLRSEDGRLLVGVNGHERHVPSDVHVKASSVKARFKGDVLHLSVPR